ncbi:MAG TPA: ImmA/IrrE family metallo-endopeptidase [Oscillatoriaceae cyanobacterium]
MDHLSTPHAPSPLRAANKSHKANDTEAEDQKAIDVVLAMLQARGDLKCTPVNLDRIRRMEDLLFVQEEEGLTYGFVRQNLASEFGIEVEGKRDNHRLEGFLYADNNVQVIYLNALSGEIHHSGRRRFTFAHELGHYFLDAKPLLSSGLDGTFQLGCSYAATERPDLAGRTSEGAFQAFRIERRANRFAAELLMPKGDLVAFLNERGPNLSLELIGEIATRYGTSFRAAAFRLIEVTDQPCALVISNLTGRVSQVSLSGELRAHPQYQIRRGHAIGTGTSLWRMANNVIKSRSPVIGWHDARQWFPSISGPHPRVLEWTQGFHGFQVFMTLLHFDCGLPA